MNTPFDKKITKIDDAEFNRIIKICEMLRRDNGVRGEAIRDELASSFSELNQKGIHPIAAVIHRTLKNGVSDEAFHLFSELLNLTATDRRFRLTDFEKELYRVMAFPFGMEMSFGISIVEWNQLAEAGRDVVLAFLESGSEEDPAYVAAKKIFDPLHASERRRLIAHPVLGKQLRDSQSM